MTAAAHRHAKDVSATAAAAGAHSHSQCTYEEDAGKTDSSILHTLLRVSLFFCFLLLILTLFCRNLMLRDGMLSPHPKMLPTSQCSN